MATHEQIFHFFKKFKKFKKKVKMALVSADRAANLKCNFLLSKGEIISS